MRTIAAMLVAVAVSGFAARSAEATGWCREGKLDILLTNDDGYAAPGIRALQTELERAGHRLIMVAPLKNQSGSSAAVTLNVVPVVNPEPDVYAVDATPATAVLVGVSAIFDSKHRPDLVVSGINNGASIGGAAPISGTVGAAIASMTQLPEAIPAIAVSTDLIEGSSSNPLSPANLAHFDEVAAFTARLVRQLIDESCLKSAPLLPSRTGLNVNYPALAVGDVRGVVTTTQARLPHFSISFAPIGGGLYAPSFAATNLNQNSAESDTPRFAAGYVTIVPVDGNYSAPADVQATVNQAIKGLQP